MTTEMAKIMVDNFVANGSVYTLWDFFWKWKGECILPKNMLLHFWDWVLECISCLSTQVLNCFLGIMF